MVKLRGQKCGLRLEFQFLELPYHSTTSWVTAGVYGLPVLKASSPKSRCWQGRALLEAPGESPSLQPLVLTGLPWVPWLPAAELWSLALMSHGRSPRVSLGLFCSHSDIGLTGFRDTLLQCDLILTRLHLQRPCFQIRSCSQMSCLSTSF